MIQHPVRLMLGYQKLYKMIFRCCDNKYWCIRDCCGMVCVFFTWGLIFYAEFVVLRVILLPEIASVYSVLNFIIFQAFAGSFAPR